MSNDESSENTKDEEFATEIMEDDDDEEENPDLPVFSVTVKEESRNMSRISSRVKIQFFILFNPKYFHFSMRLAYLIVGKRTS